MRTAFISPVTTSFPTSSRSHFALLSVRTASRLPFFAKPPCAAKIVCSTASSNGVANDNDKVTLVSNNRNVADDASPSNTINGNGIPLTIPDVAEQVATQITKKKRQPVRQRVPSVTSANLPASAEGSFCTLGDNPSLMRVLIVHCGGTFGMDVAESFDNEGHIRKGTGGTYRQGLKPSGLLADILKNVPELRRLANLDVVVAMNLDSARVGPKEWIRIAKLLDKNRDNYDAFVVIHGTDTMSYTGSALSLMLAGFRKPVVLTGSQLPMMRPRSDARQNLIDSVTCATDGVLEEFAICFGGTLLRANRAQKTSSTAYRAFSSPTHPALASLGVDVEWNKAALWKDPGVYRPRFKLETNVIRIPVIPGVEPQVAYGDLHGRGVRGACLESFGVGNMPDQKSAGWLSWLRDQSKKGLEVYLASQCTTGPLNPELYRSGSAALTLGAKATRRMTAETAVIKLMLCLGHVDLHLSYPLAGEL